MDPGPELIKDSTGLYKKNLTLYWVLKGFLSRVMFEREEKLGGDEITLDF